MSGPRRTRQILRGMARLAMLRADGLADFGDTPQDFLNSLAPLAGLAIAGTLLRVFGGEIFDALTDLVVTGVALMSPPVLSHFLARRWGREVAWLRYATAFNWCHWLVLMAFAVVLMIGTGVLAAAGIPPLAALVTAELAWAAYGLSLHWVLARRGLGISRLRTFGLMTLVELGTGVLIMGPLLLARALD
jgi:hypothetical protein